MNPDLIKELGVLADRYAATWSPGQDSYGRPSNWKEYNRLRDSYFAGLVVREYRKSIGEKIS